MFWTEEEIKKLHKNFKTIIDKRQLPQTGECDLPGTSKTNKQVYDKLRNIMRRN